jgi:hypothetical protein
MVLVRILMSKSGFSMYYEGGGRYFVQILSTPISQAAAEKVFSRGRHVISDNRSSLLPDRAEQFILCAARFAIKQSHGTLTVPTIVDIGVPFSDAEVIARDDLVDEGKKRKKIFMC